MAAIRKFFQKKRSEAKFRQAGPGQRLDSSSAAPQISSEHIGRPVDQARKSESSESAQRAGAAALARLENQTQQPADMSKRSQAVIRAKALKQLEAEKQKAQANVENIANEVSTGAPVLAVTGVYFTCPLIGPEVLPKDEMRKRIRDYLYAQLEDEKGLTACLILQTCNLNREKVKVGTQTLSKYLENIINNPGDEKFRKIRIKNKIFQERIAGLHGAKDFLTAAGFELQKLPASEDGTLEDFYVFPESKLKHMDDLQTLYEALLSAEPIQPQLDRNLKVLQFLQASPDVNLPDDFYNLTVEEIKREQQIRSELVKRNATFRTKAMRDQDDVREMRKYRYTLLRIRFPDEIVLQGTFQVREPVRNVYAFVRENLLEAKPFVLVTAVMSKKLAENDESLVSLGLVPAVILNFMWDAAEPQTRSSKKSQKHFLKKEILALVQTL